MNVERWLRGWRAAVGLFRGDPGRVPARRVMRALRRHMDRERQTMFEATYAPNQFRVFLHPDDLGRLGPLESPLRTELRAAIDREIRRRKFRSAGPVEVALVEDPEVEPGGQRIESAFSGTGEPGDPPGAADPDTDRDEKATALLEPERATRLRLAGWTLELLSGPDAGRRIEVGAEPVTVGRGRDARCRVPDPDEHLSRVHARFRVVEGGLEVEDLESANGTEIDGRRIDLAVVDATTSISLGGMQVRATPTDPGTRVS